ncbi:MAG: VPLPA-CTERM sorting domain-containing protein [Gammaproteobacteria bacterium]|nr:hypothetical protein [Chromatiales bacterium]MDP6654000.1 VPLPA-CTERM sorting domain-containing protein [Gammaproteobacteria bacterium]
MNLRKSILIIASLAFAFAMSTVQAASVSLTPALSTGNVGGSATLELFMDFTGDPTLGGGIDLALSGPISWGGFTPSAYFSALDEAFSDHGFVAADADYEIHFGSFGGLDGNHKLGDITVDLLGIGTGTIAMAINNLAGSFLSASTFSTQEVILSGAEIQVNTVPVPAAVWLFGSALGLLGGFRRRFQK